MKKLLLSLFLISQIYADVTTSGMKILPRQDAPTDGTIKTYEVLKSPDGTNWTSVTNGTLVNDKIEKTITFPQTTSRFFKLKALSEANGSKNCAISEINLVFNNTNLDRSKWVVSADSSTAQTGNNWGVPNYAIDGNVNTFWMTKWETGGTLYPHEFIIDTGTSTVTPPVITNPNESGPIVTLTWNPNPETNITTYIVSWGESTKNYTKSLNSSTTTITIPGFVVDKTYYFVIRAKNDRGLESLNSDELAVKIIDKNFPTAPMPPEIAKPERFIEVSMTINKLNPISLGKIPYPEITGQKYKTLIITENDPKFPSTTRFVNVLMILPGEIEYKSIGKIPYPVVKGQSYTSKITK